jgi:membrane-bound inhibitor of C-type lysozyme
MEWNRVTWYSQLLAIVLALVIFGLGFWLGEKKGMDAGMAMAGAPGDMSGDMAGMPMQNGDPVISDVTFACDAGKTVHGIFHQNGVQLLLSDGRNMTVPQAVSASGARYANDDESFVFWNKGNTAFITEGTGADSTTTYANCVAQPAPQTGPQPE